MANTIIIINAAHNITFFRGFEKPAAARLPAFSTLYTLVYTNSEVSKGQINLLSTRIVSSNSNIAFTFIFIGLQDKKNKRDI